MKLPIENLTIGRVCLHEVYTLGEDGAVVQPLYATGLLDLVGPAMAAFKSRVVAAFKGTSQCMDMTIRDFGPGSVLAMGADLIAARDPAFLQQSRAFANALAAAQTSRAWPGGLVVVFDGTHGNPASPFFAVMKAELYEGFLKGDDLQARFVENLFLSPKTKLYKIGLFTSDGAAQRPELPAGWTATLYDATMSATQRDNAATYFHSGFLGLSIPDNAAHRVRQFFDHTRSFIKSTNLPVEHKVDLLNGLYSYLKVDQTPTIQVGRFANTYMEEDLAADYEAFMRREKFPLTAVQKDLSEIQARLRYRKFSFPRQITLQGPPDAIEDLVSVESIEGDGGASWTRLTIRGRLEGQD